MAIMELKTATFVSTPFLFLRVSVQGVSTTRILCAQSFNFQVVKSSSLVSGNRPLSRVPHGAHVEVKRWKPVPGGFGRQSKQRTSIVSMNQSGNSSNIGLRIGAGILGIILIATSLGPVVSTLFSPSTDTASLEPKLHNVPVFAVTDSSGRPFLVEAEDHMSRRGYFFLDPADADDYLKRVQDTSTDAKVLPVALDEALKYVQGERKGMRSVPERFSLFPSGRELDIAKQMTDDKFTSLFGQDAVPLFYVDGLAFATNGEMPANVYPVFFEKESLDKTIASLREKNAAAADQLGDLEVVDLFETIREIRAGVNPRLQNVVFMPMEDALKTLKTTGTQNQ